MTYRWPFESPPRAAYTRCCCSGTDTQGEIERKSGSRLDDLLGRGIVTDGGISIRNLRHILDSRSVPQEVTDRNILPGNGRAIDIVGDGILQRQFAVIGQHQNGRDGKGFSSSTRLHRDYRLSPWRGSRHSRSRIQSP